MIDDPKNKLDQLQEKLSREDDWFQELDEIKALLDGKPVAQAAAPAAQSQTPVVTAAPQPVDEPRKKKKSNTGLVVLMILETLGIAGLAIYWLQRLL